MQLLYVLLEPVLLVYGNESHLLLYGLGSLIHLNVNWLHLRCPYAYAPLPLLYFLRYSCASLGTFLYFLRCSLVSLFSSFTNLTAHPHFFNRFLKIFTCLPSWNCTILYLSGPPACDVKQGNPISTLSLQVLREAPSTFYDPGTIYQRVRGHQ